MEHRQELGQLGERQQKKQMAVLDMAVMVRRKPPKDLAGA
jgi:hypothetical protein